VLFISAADNLLSTDAIELLISSIPSLSRDLSKIGELCGTQETNRLETMRKEVETLEAEMLGDVQEVGYLKLLNWANFDWDQQQVQFKDGQYSSWVAEDGILERIKSFVENFESYEQSKTNRRWDALINQEDLLKQILVYSKHLGDVDRYTNEIVIQREIKKIQTEFQKGTLKAVLGKNVALTKAESVFRGQVNLEQYENSKRSIMSLYASMNRFSEAVATLEDSRNSFVQAFAAYEELSKENKCPMCGYDWESIDNLKGQMETQKNHFRKLAEESGKDLKTEILSFESRFVAPISKVINTYLADNPLNETFVSELQAAAKNKTRIDAVSEGLRKRGILVENYLVEMGNPALNQKLSSFKNAMLAQKHEVDEANLKPYFSDIFVKYFDEKFDLVKNLDLRSIGDKKEYLKWQYSLHQNKSLKGGKKEYGECLARFKKASRVKDELGRLKKIYEKSLLDYQRKNHCGHRNIVPFIFWSHHSGFPRRNGAIHF